MTIRIALVVSAIVIAAMAYPWQSTQDYWVGGVAAVVVLALIAWWRGLFVTTMVGRRLAMLARRKPEPESPAANQVTMLLSVNDPAGTGLPLPVVAGYVERFGVRCDKVRVTSMDDGGGRMTWISLTLDAADNLAALAARTPELPLVDTAEIVARRLADHLRETGLAAAIVADSHAPVEGPRREKWRGVHDDRGWVSVYEVPIDQHLAQRIAEVQAEPTQTWSALEFGGTAAYPTVAAVCAVRTAGAQRTAPVAGLISHPGVQGPLLAALDPKSAQRLAVPGHALQADLMELLGWPVGDALARQT